MKSHQRAVRKGEHAMSTITGNKWRTILLGLFGAVAAAGVARADVASDKPGAILVYPKIVVDTAGVAGYGVADTEIQVTNTSNSVIAARCWIVNATSFCSNAPDRACATSADCPPGGICTPQWTENDFRMTLTKRQPVTWKASDGRAEFPCPGLLGDNCPGGQSNRGTDGTPSFVPPVQTDPFVGYMKCVEVDPNDFRPSRGLDPANNFEGDLKGEVTIVRTETRDGLPNLVDALKYNAIGIQALPPAGGDRNDVLCLGGGVTPQCPNGAEYNACPNVVIVDNYFDDAVVVTHNRPGVPPLTQQVRSELTVIPCGDDFLTQQPLSSTLQFLVYNEFEQRFSTSTSVKCFRETFLSDIDTRLGDFGDAQSIFNVGVQGTVTGQFRMRPVPGPTYANKVLAVLFAGFECDPAAHPGGICTAGVNTNFVGTPELGDVMLLSPEIP